MTREELVQQLDGRQYRDDVPPSLQHEAKAAGLVIVFGWSDDGIEFRGAIDDEGYGPGTVLVDGQGLLPDRGSINNGDPLEQFFIRRKTAKRIEALWCADKAYNWTYRTDIPHATFDILEDGKKYCRGIVFNLDDLA